MPIRGWKAAPTAKEELKEDILMNDSNLEELSGMGLYDDVIRYADLGGSAARLPREIF
jgi:hypothetical protein